MAAPPHHVASARSSFSAAPAAACTVSGWDTASWEMSCRPRQVMVWRPYLWLGWRPWKLQVLVHLAQMKVWEVLNILECL